MRITLVAYHLLAYRYEGRCQGTGVRRSAKEPYDIDGPLVGKPFGGHQRGTLG